MLNGSAGVVSTHVGNYSEDQKSQVNLEEGVCVN